MATAPVTVTANLNFNPASINAAGKQVQSAFGNINLPTKAVNNFNNSLGRITGQASEFDKSINAATARVFAFGAAVSIINGISTAFKSLVSSTIEVEKRLTEIGSILGGTTEQLGQFKNAIFDVAKNTGQTFSTVADAASELARQGLSAEETVKRLNASLILTRVSGLDAESSVNALTAAINGFTSAGLTAEQIVNKLIAVDTAFAVSAKDLAEAFSRAGSTAEDAGVSFDELLGLVTAVQQTTARGGAVIGNAFKSIFSRLSRGTVIEDLKALGVQIDSSQTGVQKLQALSDALSKISDPTQANAIKELAGGVYQINVVSAALKDLSSETSIFARASQTAGQASNEAFEKNAQLNQTLAAQINKLVQGLTELGSKIGELTIAPVIENLLTGANKLLDILNKVFDPEEGNKLIQGFFKGVGAFIAGPGLVLVSAAFFKLFQVVAKFAKEGISDLFKIGSEQERIKNIEGGIVALLQQDANLRATLLSSSTSQAQKEQAVINSIKQQNALLTQQQALVNSIAVASAKAGVGGFSSSGGFSKRKGKGMFAAGYSGEVSPEEAAMEMAAANQHGYKAGKVKKERIFDGSGSSFMGILNSAETRKDFINGSGYKSTLITPPNGFAASGFVPNFASKAGSKNYSNTKSVGLKDPNSKMSLKDVEDEISRLEALKNKDPNFSNDQQKKLDNLFLSQKLKKERLEKEQGDDGGPKLGSPQNPLLVNASRYGYLIPNLNFPTGQEAINGRLDKKWNGFNVNFKTSQNPTFAGPKIEGEAKETNKDDELSSQLSESVMDKIVNEGYSYASQLISPLVARPINKNGIKQRLGKNGNKGLFGAVQSAAGAAFEAAIAEVLGIKEASLKEKEGDFDAKQIPENLSELFKLPSGLKSADFKVSRSKGSKGSFIKKILNDNPDYYKRLLQGDSKNTTRTPKRASGFIPNFAALNDAISREMAAGVPRDKIYIDQDDSLKSPLNKQGLSVANEYDEPNGVKDGIKRAISEGKNPKTYGQNFAARGFVPNFVFGGVGGSPQAASALAATAAALMSQLPALKASTAASTAATTAQATASKAAAAATTNVSSRFQKMSGAIGALSSAFYFLAIPAIESMARAYALDEEALAKEVSARDKAVKALEAEKGKKEKANADLITALGEEVTKRNEAITKINEAADNFASKTSEISNVIANGALVLSLIPFGKIKEGLSSLAGTGVGKFLARPIAGAGVAAAGGGGSIVAGGAAAVIGTAAAAVIGAAIAGAIGVGIGKIINDNVTTPILETIQLLPSDIELVKAQIEAIDFDIGSIESEVQNYKKGLFELNQVFFFGYDQVKLVTKNIRSEFEKLNDEAGIGGFNSKLSQAESADRLSSGAQDVLLQQNLRNTRDPFEKQNLVKEREDKRVSDTVSEGSRERAVAAQTMKVGQEDFLTGISKYLNQPPSLEQIGRDVVINKAGDIGGPPDLREATKPITDILAGSKVPAFETARAIENTTVKDQENLAEAIKRVTDASENLKNSTFDFSDDGKIESNQGENLKEVLNARDALQPLLEERIKKSGGGEEEVNALNEEFKKYTDVIKLGTEAQTASIIKQKEQTEKINFDSLTKQKEILDQFIDNFNATFLQNAEIGASLFAEALASGKGNRIQENIENLKGAKLGTGFTNDASTFQKRQEALVQTTQQLESSGFFKTFEKPEEEAAFRTQLAGEQLGGFDNQILQKGLSYQSQNLQEQVKEINPNDSNAISAIASSTLAFEEVFKKIREEAVKAGDTNLTQDIDKRLATLKDPNATVGERVAAGNVNLEGTKISGEAQDEFQKSLIGAAGAVQSVIDSLKGESVARASDALGTKIEGVAAKLVTLQDALKITVDDVTLPTVIKELTTATQGLNPVVEAFKGKITELEKALADKVASLTELTKREEELKAVQNKINDEFGLSAKNAKDALVALVSPIATAMVAYEKVTVGLEAAAKRAELIASNPSPRRRDEIPAQPQTAGG